MRIVEFFLAHQRYAVLLVALLAAALLQLLLLLCRFGTKRSNEAMKTFFDCRPVLHALFCCSIGAGILGAFMNGVVMSMNAGRMPALSLPQHDDEQSASSKYRLLTSGTRLPFLADRFTLQSDYFVFHISLGDFLILPGLLSFALILVCIVPSVAAVLGAQTVVPP